MSLSIQNELVTLATSVAAFNQPVLSPGSPLPALLITDPLALARICYNQVPQGMAIKPFRPYIYWTGPWNYDKRQTAQPSRVVKKADFRFYVQHNTMTKAMAWVDAIEDAVDALSFPYNLIHCRLTAAIFRDKRPITDDQTIKTAQEFPVSQACIEYTFGYQSSGN